MKITRAATADKLCDYVQGKVGQAELVESSPREVGARWTSGSAAAGRERGRSSHWAERAMMDGEFKTAADAEWSQRARCDMDGKPNSERGARASQLLSDIIGRLSLAQPALSGAERVAEFGLRWQDCDERSPREAVRDGRSGEAVHDRAGVHQFLRRLGYRAVVAVSPAST